MLRVLLGMVALMSVFGPEQEPAPPRYGVNPTEHYEAVVAVNGAGQWLVGYDDRRGDDSLVSRGDNLHFTRVTPAGALLDPGGIEMAAAGPARHQLAMASDGRDYLVAWAESTAYNESELRVARIGADGTLLQSPTVISSAAGTAVSSPHACWDGSQYRMVFAVSQSATSVTTIDTVQLTAAGGVVAPPAPMPVSAGVYPRQPTIACLGQDSLLAWWEYATTGNSYDVRVAPWPASGAPGSAASIMLPGGGPVQSVSLAAGSDGFLAIWDEQRGSSGPALVGQVLGRTGARTSAADIPLLPAAATAHFGQVAFDGSAWRVLAQQLVGGLEQAWLGTIATSGQVTLPLGGLTSASARSAPTSLACVSGGCLVTWTDANQYLVAGTRVSSAGSALDSPPLYVSLPSDEQSPARLVWDGQQLLVVWGARVGRAASELLVRRQDGSGAWLDPAPISVGPASGALVSALPEGGFALVYLAPSAQTNNATDMIPAFVSRAGAVTRAAPLISTSSPLLYSMACGAAECHVFGQVGTSDVAFRMDHQGARLNAQALPIHCDQAVAAFDQVWCAAKTSATSQLTLSRFDGSLAALGSPLLLSQTNERPDVGMVMQADAGAVTVIWSALHLDTTTQAQTEKAKVARVGADGQLVDPPRDLPLPFIGSFFPQRLISAGGARWLYWYTSDGTTVWHLRVQQLATDLTLVGPVAELTAGGLELAYLGMDAVNTAADEVAVAYLVRDADPDRGSHRVRLRLTANPPPSPDGGGSDAGGAPDAGTDAAADASPPPPPPDSGSDAADAIDAGAERAPDAMIDVGPDLVPPTDAAPDTTVEPRPDATADLVVDRAAADVAGPRPAGGGCGCRTAEGKPGVPASLCLLLALGLTARRRRR